MAKWTVDEAAHLMRRTGFVEGGASALKKAAKQGRKKTIKKLFKADPTSDEVAAEDLDDGLWKIQYLWLMRMAATSSPLIERLTLFWHNHFATAESKVNNRLMMVNHVRTLRRNCLGKFRDMVLDVARDPAMIVWLDNKTNIKDEPNENFARELMELFTTGVLDKHGDPNYTEDDVAESARAFTGWTIDSGGAYVFKDYHHDFGMKSFRGISGPLDGVDIIEDLVLDPATARRICWKLWSFFAYDVALDDPLLDKFEAIYLKADTEIKPVLKAMFNHKAFYSSEALYARVKSPVEHAVNMALTLAATFNDAFGYNFTDLVNDMGQSLYDPPTVFGWKEGLPWLGANGLLERMRAAQRMTSGRVANDPVVFDPVGWLGKPEKYSDWSAEKTVKVILKRLGLDGRVPQAVVDALVAYTLADPSGNPVDEFVLDAETIDLKVRGVCSLAMSLPQFQRS